MTTPQDRALNSGYVPWSPITTRPVLRWPGGAKVAICVLVHLEHAELKPPPGTVIPPTMVHRGPYPELPDYHEVTPREYGNRVGAFRIIELLDDLGVRASAPTDAHVATHYRPLVDAGLERGWEFLGHAPISSRLLTGQLSEAEEVDYLATSLEGIRSATGAIPRGWAGVDFAETSRTVELLAGMGVDYTCNWPNDDQPYEMTVPAGRMTSLPVAIHLDDVWAHHRRGISMERWSRMARESFDRLHEEGAESGRLLVLSLHPWLSGHPFRMRHVREALVHLCAGPDVWLATGSEIVDQFRAQCGSAAPPVRKALSGPD